MFQLTRFQIFLAFIALMMLRFAVGFHFFKEGTSKLKSGNFSAEPFLASAKGPLAPEFKAMLDDPDGRIKFGVNEVIHDDGTVQYSFNPKLTYLLWNDFVDQATQYYGFGSDQRIQKIDSRIKTNTTKIAELVGDPEAVSVLNEQALVDQQNLDAVRSQPQRANEIFADHKAMLSEFFEDSGITTELKAFYGTAGRLDGFKSDGQHRQDVALYVDSLRGQVDTIAYDRKKKLTELSDDVVTIWDSFENQINSLAVGEQSEMAPLKIHRNFDQPASKLKMVNRVIPWFDTIIGVLLILGLFSRIASGAAALFLLSVIATQPPWIPGTAPTYFYAIELAACLVIFATCAGRYGGLDYFFSRKTELQTQNQLP